MWYNGITKFDLFNWIDESNIETNEKNILKTRINIIKRGDGGLFKDLPDTYKINIGSKNGVSCLHVLNKRRYGEEKKKSIFDLMLKRSGWKERLLTQLKEFASEIKVVSIDESIKKTESYLAYRKLVRRKLERVFNVVTIICALMALVLFCMVIADAIVSFDNDGIVYKIITPGATMCGILDFIFGVCFASIERAEDDRERIFMLAIARDQKKSLRNTNKELGQRNKEYESNNNNLNKQVEELKTINKKYESDNSKLNEQVEELKTINKKYESNNSKLNEQVEELTKKNNELTDIINKAKGIGESYSLQQEKLKQKEAKLGICEQCHVPLGQVCNVCGHKYSTPLPMEKENVYIQKKSDEFGYRVIQVDKEVAILVCDAEKINLSNILIMSGNDDVDDLHRIRPNNVSWVKRIVFTSAVQNIVLDDNGSTDSLKSLFPGVNIVGFAKPEEGLKQYHLGKNVFNKVNDIEIIGLEYIAEGEAG